MGDKIIFDELLKQEIYLIKLQKINNEDKSSEMSNNDKGETQEQAAEIISQMLNQFQIFNKKLNISILLISVYFNFEITKNYVKCLSQLNQLKSYYQSNQISFFDLLHYDLIYEKIVYECSSYYISKKQCYQPISFISAIDYEEKSQKFEMKFLRLTSEIKGYYRYLCSQNLDLQQIFEQSHILMETKRKVRKTLKEIEKIDSDNLYTHVFKFIFSDEKKQIQQISRGNSQNQKVNKNITKILSNNDSCLNCLIYCKLIREEFIVQKASNSFKQIFTSQESINGKNILDILPKEIKLIKFGSDQYLKMEYDNYIKQGSQFIHIISLFLFFNQS